MKNFFSEQLSKQMMVLNENFEDFFQDEKLFFKHLYGLQNKADYLLDSLNQIKSSMISPDEIRSRSRLILESKNTEEINGKHIVNEDDLTTEQKVRILEGKVDFIIRNMGDENNLNSRIT
jgi:hypothetical protein